MKETLCRAWRCLFLFYALETRARAPRPETGTGSGGAKFLEYRTMAILFLCLAIQTHVLQASLGQGHTKKRHLHALFHI
jgi:hypothetical protein